MKKNFYCLVLLIGLTCSIQAKADTQEIVVGNGTNNNGNVGFCELYEYFASQTIYNASDINYAGAITKIAFQINSVSSGGTESEVKIYMGHINKTSFTSGSDIISNLTLVYDNSSVILGEPNVNNGWEEITLSTAFNYNGNQNLVVAISTKKSQYKSNLYKCKKNTDKTSISCVSITDQSCADVYGNKMNEAEYIPNTRFTFEFTPCIGSHSCTTHNSQGFGICDICHQIDKTVYEEPEWVETSPTSGYFNCKNLGNLMWFANEQNSGKFVYNYQLSLSKDIEIEPNIWQAIGNESYPFMGSIHGPYNINGLNADQYLIGVMNSSAYVQNIRMNNGAFVNKAKGGKIRYCFTEGSLLANSGSFTNTNSYCLDGSNTSQLNSGEITYYLNNFGRNSNWYQTIGTDSYPTLDNKHSIVYRYTKCDQFKYTNDSQKSNSKELHNLNNGICSNCGTPTYISQDVTIVDANDYIRTLDADVDGIITYRRDFKSEEIGTWQSLYIPIAFTYTEELVNTFDIASIEDYSTLEGESINKVIIKKISIGASTEPNKPYLIRPKKIGFCSFVSNDNILYAANINQENVSRDNDLLTFIGNYSSRTGLQTEGLLTLSNSTLSKVNNDSERLRPFRWSCNTSHVDASAWTSPTSITTTLAPWIINDNGTNGYEEELPTIADKLIYTRTFNSGWINKWQTFYLPFDLTINDLLESKADFARFSSIETQNGVEVFIIEKIHTGTTVYANTPFVIRIKDNNPFTLTFTDKRLYGMGDGEPLKVESNQAVYTFTGVYETYEDVNPWYGLSRQDGLFHPASPTANLAPFRFYLTIEPKELSSASALRFGVVEVGFEEGSTGIRMMEENQNNNSITYTIEGRRVEGVLQPGLYIKNGKKMLIRK